MHDFLRRALCFGLSAGMLSLPTLLPAQQEQQRPPDLVDLTEAEGLSEGERQRNQESLERELSGAYRKWLEEDVGYIITDEERRVFRSLQNDEEREQFIEQFWLRRSPDPESLSNDYKEEH